MGVYRKVGEVNGEDRYRQLDSRRSGHVLHLQVKKSSLETAMDQFQWQIEKPCSKDHNGEMRKRVDPTHKSLFLFSNWMFKAEYVYGKMIADEDCKVVKFSPFLREQCNRITIKTPYLESGGGKWKKTIRIFYLHLHNKFLAPTGAQGEAMSCVRACVRACVHDIIQKNIENEF